MIAAQWLNARVCEWCCKYVDMLVVTGARVHLPLTYITDCAAQVRLAER